MTPPTPPDLGSSSRAPGKGSAKTQTQQTPQAQQTTAQANAAKLQTNKPAPAIRNLPKHMAGTSAAQKLLQNLLKSAPKQAIKLLNAFPGTGTLAQNAKSLALQLAASKSAGLDAMMNKTELANLKSASEDLSPKSLPLMQKQLLEGSDKRTKDASGSEWRSWLLNWSAQNRLNQFSLHLNDERKNLDEEKDKKKQAAQKEHARFALRLDLTSDIGPVIVDGWVIESKKQLWLVVRSYQEPDEKWQAEFKQKMLALGKTDGWSMSVAFQTVSKLEQPWLDYDVETYFKPNE